MIYVATMSATTRGAGWVGVRLWVRSQSVAATEVATIRSLESTLVPCSRSYLFGVVKVQVGSGPALRNAGKLAVANQDQHSTTVFAATSLCVIRLDSGRKYSHLKVPTDSNLTKPRPSVVHGGFSYEPSSTAFNNLQRRCSPRSLSSHPSSTRSL